MDDQTYNSRDSQITDWVLSRCENWRNQRDENYLEEWKRYERLWRGLWAGEDSTRESERSRIVTPALQQAIESSVAEIEEAVFGRGEKFFDITDDLADKNRIDVEQLKNQMYEDFKKEKVRKAVSDTIVLGAVYGTGIGEIVIAEKNELAPASRPIVEMSMTAVGVEERSRFVVGLKPINPKNFLIDPNATSIEDALGCAIEEYVSLHSVVAGMESGVYKTVPNFGPTAVDSDLEPVQETIEYQQDKVLLLRYYGLIPKFLLDSEDTEQIVKIFADKTDEFGTEAAPYTDLVEGIIVIANDQYLLKAEQSPYMMQDRPIVAFQYDSMPNRFWGRGIAEKGYNCQRAIDAQIRAHLDSLALTTVPMMGIDATRLPRGSKFEVRPGKTILTNGNPNEILQAFKFGVTDPGNLQTAGEFMKMLLMATGTVDSASLPAAGADGAGLNPALSAIIKKNKRTLVNFQEQFLIPFVSKAAYRFMQFDPERYPAQDYNFIPASNLGIVAREYEQMQFMNLLKTLGPESPVVPLVLKAIVENSSLNNREEMIQQLNKMMQPNPQQQQVQQQAMQMQMQKAQLELADLQADIQLKQARTQAEVVDTQLKPQELQASIAASASKYLGDNNQATAEFERRVKVANLALKEKDINTKKDIANLQVVAARQN
jgi:uncharacterized membrane-anchored protein YhcB (DUF1043 family)